jgi:hypothetical protein
MSASPANTNDRDEVEPWFVVKVAVLALAIHVAFDCETYGPYAVAIFFGCWRLAASVSEENSDSQKRRHSGAPSLRKWSAAPWWRHVGWRVLAAVILLAVSFVLGATR